MPETDSESIIILPSNLNSLGFEATKVSYEVNLSETPFYTLITKRILSSIEWLSGKTIE